jgi:hypothetical protein
MLLEWCWNIDKQKYRVNDERSATSSHRVSLLRTALKGKERKKLSLLL